MSKFKKMDIKEFREKGFLQEVNRQFFHPHGLALSIMIDDDGNETLDAVFDVRDDPEGMIFADSQIIAEKAATVLEQKKVHQEHRLSEFGWIVQPVPQDREPFTHSGVPNGTN